MTTSAEAGPRKSPLAAARAVAPLAAACADQAESARRLPTELVDALSQAGLFRLCVPASLGGTEASVAELVDVLEELGRADGAASWCAAIACTGGAFAAYMPEADAREVYGDAGSCVGGVFAPKGLAVAGDDGFTVSGRWPFTTGVDHCDWLMGGCFVEEEGQIRTLDSGTPDVRLMLFPAPEAEVIDTWSVSGLRGTGSHDMEVTNLRVPAGRTASLYGDTPRETGPLYAFPVFGLLALAITGVGLGIARGAVQDLVELAGGKVPSLQVKTLAAQTDTQLRVAKAEASLRAARALVSEAVGEAWTEAEHDGGVTLERRAALRMAASHAMTTSAAVVGEMYSLAGGSAIYDDSSLQRRFRDIHVATQHAMVGPSSWQVAGRVLLGVPVRPEQF